MKLSSLRTVTKNRLSWGRHEWSLSLGGFLGRKLEHWNTKITKSDKRYESRLWKKAKGKVISGEIMVIFKIFLCTRIFSQRWYCACLLLSMHSIINPSSTSSTSLSNIWIPYIRSVQNQLGRNMKYSKQTLWGENIMYRNKRSYKQTYFSPLVPKLSGSIGWPLLK